MLDCERVTHVRRARGIASVGCRTRPRRAAALQGCRSGRQSRHGKRCRSAFVVRDGRPNQQRAGSADRRRRDGLQPTPNDPQQAQHTAPQHKASWCRVSFGADASPCPTYPDQLGAGGTGRCRRHQPPPDVGALLRQSTQDDAHAVNATSPPSTRGRTFASGVHQSANGSRSATPALASTRCTASGPCRSVRWLASARERV